LDKHILTCASHKEEVFDSYKHSCFINTVDYTEFYRSLFMRLDNIKRQGGTGHKPSCMHTVKNVYHKQPRMYLQSKVDN